MTTQATPLPMAPIVIRIVTEPGAMVWTIGELRPDGFGGQIVRMFVTDVGAEMYTRGVDAASSGVFCRHSVPWTRVLSTEEMMTEEAFAHEIAAAESDEGEGEGYDGDEQTDPQAARSLAQRTGT